MTREEILQTMWNVYLQSSGDSRARLGKALDVVEPAIRADERGLPEYSEQLFVAEELHRARAALREIERDAPRRSGVAIQAIAQRGLGDK